MVEDAYGVIVGVRPVPEGDIVVLCNDVDERHEVSCVLRALVAELCGGHGRTGEGECDRLSRLPTLRDDT